MSLIGLLLGLLVVCIVVWAARAILTAFGVGDPIRTVVMVVIVLVALIWLLGALGAGGPILNPIRLR